mmetsp:Transcript_170518/g.546928  ORF Transcript_170518/g.546928 Transcript_170518/m.546928 type:complete len:201 (+) Transcript_170518:197-799(+)
MKAPYGYGAVKLIIGMGANISATGGSCEALAASASPLQPPRLRCARLPSNSSNVAKRSTRCSIQGASAPSSNTKSSSPQKHFGAGAVVARPMRGCGCWLPSAGLTSGVPPKCRKVLRTGIGPCAPRAAAGISVVVCGGDMVWAGGRGPSSQRAPTLGLGPPRGAHESSEAAHCEQRVNCFEGGRGGVERRRCGLRACVMA